MLQFLAILSVFGVPGAWTEAPLHREFQCSFATETPAHGAMECTAAGEIHQQDFTQASLELECAREETVYALKDSRADVLLFPSGAKLTGRMGSRQASLDLGSESATLLLEGKRFGGNCVVKESSRRE